MNPFGLLFIAAGIFSICGAVFDWEFFMNNRKAWLFVTIFGRNGARVIYVLLGLGIVVMGVLFTFGILKDSA